MPVWRNPDLETALDGPIDDSLTEQALLRMVGRREDQHQEYKKPGGYGPASGTPSWLPEQEFAKDVSAFANQSGGVIFIGLNEQSQIAVAPLVPITGTTPEFEMRRLRQALANHQEPLSNVAFIPVALAAGDFCLLVVVPPSMRAPHAVRDSRDSRRPLRYPIRRGADTNWLTESEVADFYRRRVAGVTERHDRENNVVAEALRFLRRATGLWVWTCCVPEFAVFGDVSASEVEFVESWYRQSGWASPLGRTLHGYGRAIPAPGRVTFTDALLSSVDNEADPVANYIELGVDGSSFASKQLTPLGNSEEEQAQTRRLPEFTLVDDVTLLVDLCIRWALERVGAWGTASLLIGVVDPVKEMPLDPLELGSYDGPRWHRVGPRLVGHWPDGRTVVDLGAMTSRQAHLAAAHDALSVLLQWFGLAEPLQIRSDGAVVPRQWTMSNYRRVEQWAAQNGIDCEVLD